MPVRVVAVGGVDELGRHEGGVLPSYADGGVIAADAAVAAAAGAAGAGAATGGVAVAACVDGIVRTPLPGPAELRTWKLESQHAFWEQRREHWRAKTRAECRQACTARQLSHVGWMAVMRGRLLRHDFLGVEGLEPSDIAKREIELPPVVAVGGVDELGRHERGGAAVVRGWRRDRC